LSNYLMAAEAETRESTDPWQTGCLLSRVWQADQYPLAVQYR